MKFSRFGLGLGTRTLTLITLELSDVAGVPNPKPNQLNLEKGSRLGLELGDRNVTLIRE